MFKLTKALRSELMREGYAYARANPGVESYPEPWEIADHLFGIMLDNEKYGTEDYEAIEISDYAYGIATFVTGGRS